MLTLHVHCRLTGDSAHAVLCHKPRPNELLPFEKSVVTRQGEGKTANFTLAFKGFYPEVTHISSFHTSSVKASHGIMPKFKGKGRYNTTASQSKEFKY